MYFDDSCTYTINIFTCLNHIPVVKIAEFAPNMSKNRINFFSSWLKLINLIIQQINQDGLLIVGLRPIGYLWGMDLWRGGIKMVKFRKFEAP